jgi:hypothetical protein
MLKHSLAAVLILAAATPAFAKDAFYIVQDKAKKTCTVMKEKPTKPTMVIVTENGMMFASETDARAAMKKTKVCVTK